MLFTLPLALLAIVPSTFGKPTPQKQKGCECNISKVKLELPTCQTQLVEPTTPPKFITIGVGVQNYTCGAAGTFGSVGAVAQLFDASCAATKGLTTLDRLPSQALKEFQSYGKYASFSFIGPKLGDHVFVTNPTTNTGIVPRFDFTQSQRNSQDFFDGTKAGDVVSPTDAAANVDWLMLNHLVGDLATTVFRVQTKGGQPPTKCTGTQATSIPYAAEYWFF